MEAIPMAKRKRRHKPVPPVKQPQVIKPMMVEVKAPDRKSKKTSTAIARQPDPLTIPQRLSTSRQINGYLGKLFADANATPIASALVPWLAGDLDSNQSRRDYMQAIRQFAVAMGEQGLHVLDVTGNDVKLYKAARMAAGDRPATVAQSLSVLRGMYRQLGQAHLVQWDTVADIEAVKAPKVEKNTTPGLTHDQACDLLNAPDLDTLPGMRDHAMLFAFFYTAFRVSAMGTAKVGGLEQADGQWYVNVTEKRGKERRLELLDATPAVMRWVEAAELTDYPTWPLFPAFDQDRKTILDRHLSRDTIRKMIKRYGRKVGIHVDGVTQADGQKRRGIGVHSLRKTAATEALRNGAALQDVQQWLGHESITTTQLYTTNTGEEAKRAQRHVKIRPSKRT